MTAAIYFVTLCALAIGSTEFVSVGVVIGGGVPWEIGRQPSPSI